MLQRYKKTLNIEHGTLSIFLYFCIIKNGNMSKIHLNCIDFSTIKTKVVIFDHFYICFNYSENTIKHEHKKKSTC